MYKRQFSKWHWRKYNAKGYWDSHFNGDQVETPSSRAKCKRPRRKQSKNGAARNNTDGSLEASYHGQFLSSTFTYGNRVDSSISELFVELRDLICGNNRRNPDWSKSGRFVILPRTGQHVGRLLNHASYLYRTNNHCASGAALRRAFILLEELTKNEAIDTYRALFFDIPYDVPEAVLETYFGHLSRLLSINRACEPIARMAMMLERLSREARTHLFSVLGRMHDIQADLYEEIRGENDLNSLEARFESLALSDRCGAKPAEGHARFLARYDAVVKETASSFGPCSSEVLAVEQRQVLAATELSVEHHVRHELCERHHRRLLDAHGSMALERWSATSLYQFCRVSWRLQVMESFTERKASSHFLEQAIFACQYALAKAKLGADSGDRSLLSSLTNFGNVCEGILFRLGRNKEANELRASLDSCKLMEQLSSDITDKDGFA